MKTYYLMLSQVFPVTHARAGQPTGFKEKVEAAIKQLEGEWWKLHTIRGNYERWEKIFDEIYNDKAYLSIRVWEGKPYRSKQIELARLTRKDGIGLQRLTFSKGYTHHYSPMIDYKPKDITILAKTMVSLKQIGDFGSNTTTYQSQWQLFISLLLDINNYNMEDKTMRKSKEEIRDIAVTAGLVIETMIMFYTLIVIFG